MPAAFSKNDLELHKAFGIILSIKSFSDYIIDIAELIYSNKLNRENIQEVLDEHKIRKIEDIKEELLDLLIVYINLILNDHVISENEKFNIELLKKYFKIKEGDFYRLRYPEVKDILQRQFQMIYLDNTVDSLEALHNVELQQLFNLSYDQFDEFKNREIQRAIEQGADITSLDTAKIPKAISFVAETTSSVQFPKNLENLAWNRDHGKCRLCGNDEQLRYSHVIPLSKGGSNTLRNVQLLCESCDRKETDKIEE